MFQNEISPLAIPYYYSPIPMSMQRLKKIGQKVLKLEHGNEALTVRRTDGHSKFGGFNIIPRHFFCAAGYNKKAYICHKQKKKKTRTHHMLSITEYPYFSSLWVKIDQLKQLKGYTMMFQYIPCDFWLCLDFFSASFCHCLFSMCEMLQF